MNSYPTVSGFLLNTLCAASSGRDSLYLHKTTQNKCSKKSENITGQFIPICSVSILTLARHSNKFNYVFLKHHYQIKKQSMALH